MAMLAPVKPATEATRLDVAVHAAAPVPTPPNWIEKTGFASVVAISAFFELSRLSQQRQGNLYYAATVRSMLTSWHNFFFASFDPGGFVTVDKPPLGFWIQAASAKVFGIHAWSLVLPEALAAVASVALLYSIVKRIFGALAATIAALVLAVTPIAVVTARNNTIDSLLVLAMLIAVWAVLRAVERRSLGWLLAGAVILGLGFNIKMIEAYLVLPALWLGYLVAAQPRLWVRLAHVTLASVVLLGVSLSWAVAVDLTPAAQRPYVGSSTDNSEIQLITQYNGLNRLLPRRGAFGVDGAPAVRPGLNRPDRAALPPPALGGGPIPFGPSEIGNAGPLRLFGPQLAGQIAWLLSLALLGLVLGATAFWRERLGRAGMALFGGWLVTEVVFFSAAGEFHRYYMTTMAPALAAMAGVAAAVLWSAVHEARRLRWLLPAALIGCALVQAAIVWRFAGWRLPLSAAATGGSLAAAMLLVWAYVRGRHARLAGSGLALGILALLVAPAVWAGIPVFSLPDGNLAAVLPAAGPALGSSPRFAPPPGAEFTRADPKLVQFLDVHQGSTKYLVATPSSNLASPLILATGRPVMALGGFSGQDPIVTADQLPRLVQDGVVRYFLVGGLGGPVGAGAVEDDAWVTAACSPVPEGEWRGTIAPAAGPRSFGVQQQLYDCA